MLGNAGGGEPLTLSVHVLFELGSGNPEHLSDPHGRQFSGFDQFIDQLIVDSEKFCDLFQRVKFDIHIHSLAK